MTTRKDTEGVWGAIARGSEGVPLAEALVAELESGLSLLKTLPPAVTFFGGARIRPDDAYYAAGLRMGELLADTGIPPRTGAGPGIMSAVPEGFRRRLLETAPAVPLQEDSVTQAPTGRAQALTQGFNIKLPFEQRVNPAIDVSLELVHFPTRKMMLYVNTLGIVIFPGGFGTLDELFEVWRLKIAGRRSDPIVLYGRDFWDPIIDCLRGLTRSSERETVPEEAFGLVDVCDDAEEAIGLITGSDEESGRWEESPESLGRRVAHELVEGLEYLNHLPTAVTVIGGSRLCEGDPAVVAAEEIARRLAMEGVPTRAGGPGPFSVALAHGGHAGAPYLPQQAFGMRREDARNLYGADRVHLVNDRITHKVLLTEGSQAVVALPGGLGTLDELFSILCQLQTRKIAPRRVVAIGRSFWQPFLDVLSTQMWSGARQTIGPADLSLVTVTDDPEEAAALCLLPPPNSSAS